MPQVIDALAERRSELCRRENLLPSGAPGAAKNRPRKKGRSPQRSGTTRSLPSSAPTCSGSPGLSAERKQAPIKGPSAFDSPAQSLTFEVVDRSTNTRPYPAPHP